MNCSRLSAPCSICASLNSHSAVSSGEKSSGTPRPCRSVIKENAFAVGVSSRPSRRTYFSWIRPSMIWARVAGVPSPFSRIASRSSSSSIVLPAPSIAESSVASLNRAGGLVWLATTRISSVATFSLARTLASIGSSVDCASLPYTASQPGLTSTLPSVLKGSPATRVMRVVSRYSAAG